MEDSQPSYFATTRWTLVGRAAENTGSAATEALGELLQTYWLPLYRHARRRGKSVEDARDLVQGFYAHVIGASALGGVDRSKGRFRSFMLAAFNHWMINDWRRGSCLKRGGTDTVLSLDWEEAETGLRLEIPDERTPEREFDRDWANALLARVMADLEAGCRADGSGPQFDQLQASLAGDSSRLPYAELGERLGISENAARVAVHRLRKRFRQLLREEIARTIRDPGSVEEEMAALFAALSR